MQFFIADAILSKKKCPELQKQFIIICYYLVLIWLLNNVSLAALFDQEIQKKNPTTASSTDWNNIWLYFTLIWLCLALSFIISIVLGTYDFSFSFA